MYSFTTLTLKFKYIPHPRTVWMQYKKRGVRVRSPTGEELYPNINLCLLAILDWQNRRLK